MVCAKMLIEGKNVGIKFQKGDLIIWKGSRFYSLVLRQKGKNVIYGLILNSSSLQIGVRYFDFLEAYNYVKVYRKNKQIYPKDELNEQNTKIK